MIRKGDLLLSCSKGHNPTFTTKKKKKEQKSKAAFIYVCISLFVFLSTNGVLYIFCQRDSSLSSFTAWEIVRYIYILSL